MTHEEMMDRAMAEYWRRIEEEENKKKEVIAMMTHEEMWNKARQDIDDTGLFTEDEAEYRENNALILVDDIDKVYEACYDDLEKGFEDEDEDIYGFLDRHGIEWK